LQCRTSCCYSFEVYSVARGNQFSNNIATGLTAQYLATDRDKTLKGETVLIHFGWRIEQFLTNKYAFICSHNEPNTSASKAKIALKWS
jgi:hypothetical protein